MGPHQPGILFRSLLALQGRGGGGSLLSRKEATWGVGGWDPRCCLGASPCAGCGEPHGPSLTSHLSLRKARALGGDKTGLWCQTARVQSLLHPFFLAAPWVGPIISLGLSFFLCSLFQANPNLSLRFHVSHPQNSVPEILPPESPVFILSDHTHFPGDHKHKYHVLQ